MFRTRGWTFAEIAILGLPCAVGLVGAFVGLGASSFWIDELFTAQVVGADHDFLAMLSRAIHDVNPPGYYVLLFLWSQIAGFSDISIRWLSAMLAVAAIGIFCFGARRSFSARALLFACGMATGSYFWFYQSQNARSYSASLAIGAGMAAISLAILRNSTGQRKDALRFLLLFALALSGVFVHFYGLYEGLAVFGLLGLLRRERRWLALALLVALAAIAGAYIELVVRRWSPQANAPSWIENNYQWYARQLSSAIHLTVNKFGLVALAICLGAIAIALLSQRARMPAVTPPPTGDRRATEVVARSRSVLELGGPGATLILCVGVPLLVVLQGVIVSALVSPNLTDRNLLITSPFIWGAFASVFDAGVERLIPPLRSAAVVAVSLSLAAMATVVTGRTLPRNEPFRGTSDWITAIPACRGSEIPVLLYHQAAWGKSGDAEIAAEASLYSRYLNGFARPRGVLIDDLMTGQVPADLKAELQRRIDGVGCPVIAWSAHGVYPRQQGPIASQLLAVADRRSALPAAQVRRFRVYGYGLSWKVQEPTGFVFFVSK